MTDPLVGREPGDGTHERGPAAAARLLAEPYLRDIAKLEAEVVRLREENDRLVDRAVRLEAELAAADEENERQATHIGEVQENSRYLAEQMRQALLMVRAVERLCDETERQRSAAPSLADELPAVLTTAEVRAALSLPASGLLGDEGER